MLPHQKTLLILLSIFGFGLDFGWNFSNFKLLYKEMETFLDSLNDTFLFKECTKNGKFLV